MTMAQHAWLNLLIDLIVTVGIINSS